MTHAYNTRQRYTSSPRARRRRIKRLVRKGLCAIFALSLCGLVCWGGFTLWGMAGQNRVLNEISAREDIPQSLQDLAQRNPEAAAFVAGWPGRGGTGEAFIETSVGTIPQLLQWDERWGYETYGDDFMANTGCAPTCLSMVAVGLTGNGGLTPLYMAQKAEQGGYYAPGTGTSWEYMTSGAAEVGLYGTEIPLSQSSIDATLTEGGAVICSVRPGDFTTAGHFIVLAGHAAGGGYTVYDPNSPHRSGQSWSYEKLEPQIKNLWGYGAA